MYTVVHIEDNVANLKLIERIFDRRSGIQLIAANQGRMGLELIRQNRPTMVLLDLHLPDMNGIEILSELANDPLTASIPVVVVSADATPGQRQRLLAAGAHSYLTKPLDILELLQVVDTICDNATPRSAP